RSEPRKLRLSRLHRSRGHRMDIHKNARLTPRGRTWIVQQFESGHTPKVLATPQAVTPATPTQSHKRSAGTDELEATFDTWKRQFLSFRSASRCSRSASPLGGRPAARR